MGDIYFQFSEAGVPLKKRHKKQINPGTQADLVKESNANYKDQTDPGCLHGTHYIIQGGSFSYGDFGDMCIPM